MSAEFDFEIKRLVLVDSAGFCYVELPVDHHAILLGEGNVGKSSLLNSLRLFMLPENNFKNSKAKFAFSTPKRDGFYNNEESYNHYFPSKFSFLILEATNNIGGQLNTHCQILCRSAGQLAYERIFTPLPYEHIRHLFWQGGDCPDGIGARVDTLSSSGVFNALKKLSPHTVSVKDPAKLKALLYANDFLSPVAMRYSVFPLSETDDARIESLRTLILLLFEMNSGSATVANAVANIIEADKKFADDQLNFNIEQFLAKHTDLKHQEAQLTNIANLQAQFSRLSQQFNQFKQLADCEQQFVSFIIQLEKALEEAKVQLSAGAAKVNQWQTTIKQSKAENQQTRDAVKQLTWQVNAKDKEITQAGKAIAHAESLLITYPDQPIDEVLEMINEDISENQKRLGALENESQKARRIDELQHRIRAGEAKAQQLSARIEHSEYAMMEQLSGTSLETLAAINKRLLIANPQRPLNVQEFQTIAAFSQLFDRDQTSVSFYGEAFDKQQSRLQNNDKAELDEIVANLNADKRQLQQLQQGHSNPLNQANEIKAIKREIDTASKEHQAISELAFNRKIVEKNSVILTQAKAQLDAAVQAQTQTQQQFEQHQQEFESARAARDQISQGMDLLISLKRSSEPVLTQSPRCQQALAQHAQSDNLPAQKHEFSHELSQNTLNQLSINLRQIEELKAQLIQGLQKFIYEQIIHDEFGLMAESPSGKVVKQSFDKLAEVYGQLEGRQKILGEQIRVHNESVQGYVEILKKNHEHVRRFEQQLNRDFAQITINDLAGIEVDIHIDKRFENLVHEINAESFDLFSDASLSENFYNRLQAFASAFFKQGDSAKLTMDQVVTNLSYRTQKAGQNSWQTKQQSNSTTALINLKLVQVLLRRLRANGCALMFPLVLDEVATVDVKQFNWLLDDIKASGFNLFAASTHSASPELIYKIGRHHEVGAMRTAKPYSKERTLVYWGGAEYFADSDALGQMSHDEQLSLIAAEDDGALG